jgi:hypothetical protein
MTKHQVIVGYRRAYKPILSKATGKPDWIAIAMDWNNYVDELIKLGEVDYEKAKLWEHPRFIHDQKEWCHACSRLF